MLYCCVLLYAVSALVVLLTTSLVVLLTTSLVVLLTTSLVVLLTTSLFLNDNNCYFLVLFLQRAHGPFLSKNSLHIERDLSNSTVHDASHGLK